MDQIVIQAQVSDAMSQNNNSDLLEFVTRHSLAKPTLEESFIIRTSFFTGMESYQEVANRTILLGIYKNINSSWSRKARVENFYVLAKAVADRCGGDANIKYAWYGVTSRDEIEQILMHGFGCFPRASCTNCISLSPANFSCLSLLSADVDSNGVGHLLLCRVILGKQEVVTADSNQFHPSSSEFDSGVDDLSAPRKYIIWSPYINSHILPCYIISFQAPYLRGFNGFKGLPETKTIKPRLPWIKFPTLFSTLSRFLGPSNMASLYKEYTDFIEKKITRAQLIQRVKEIAGNQLLFALVYLCTNKEFHVSSSNNSKSKRPLIQLVD